MKRHLRYLAGVAGMALFALALLSGCDAARAADPVQRGLRNALEKIDRDDLRSVVRDTGEIRVTVGLNNRNGAARSTAGRARHTTVKEVAARQDRLLARLISFTPRNVNRLRLHDFVTMTVGAAGLEALLADADVISVAEDRPLFPSLATSTVSTRANLAWSSGYRGAGQLVAILDTGVETSHPLFAGGVAHEACFSWQFSNFGQSQSFCPGGAPRETGTGSAQPCTMAGCDHGTHVAGIAAGRNNVAGAPLPGGVAPLAGIVALQVFQKYCTETNGCQLAAFISDVAGALDHVLCLKTNPASCGVALAQPLNIAAANISIGDNINHAAPDCDATSPALATIISNLRDAGVATVVASGNNGFSTGLNFPGCISNAVSVGSTANATTVTNVSGFSNSSSQLSLLAPGEPVTSALPGGGYGGKSGTSMATPHVTGAFAILRSAKPTATVNEMLLAMQNSGLPVTDTRNQIIKPFIQLSDLSGAIGALLPNQLPSAAMLTPVNGAIITAPASVTLSATASDPDGSISLVEYYVGATKIGEATAPPYAVSWAATSAGNFILTARAIDNRAGTTISTAITVTVVVPVTYQISGTITASVGGALAGVTLTPTGAAGATCNPSDAGGQFVCVVPQGVAGTLTITPSLGGYVFVPASRSYSNLTASSSGQNFTGSTSSVAVPGLPLWGQCLLAIALLGAALCRRGGFYRRE